MRWLLLCALMLMPGIGAAEAPLTSPRPMPRGEDIKPPEKPKPPPLATQLQAAGLSGQKSLLVMDAVTGEVLESYTPETLLPPASVTKAITALYALNSLGSQWQYSTRLVATGPIISGIVQGDLALIGSGDPILDSDAIGVMVDQMKDAGIKGISGAFQIYEDSLPYQNVIDPDQPDHLGYNPSLSGLNMNFNRVFFEWKRKAGGYSTSLQARARKHSPEVTGINMAVTPTPDPTYTYQQNNGEDSWTVARPALGSGGNRWLPVRNPAFYAAEVMRVIARQSGVKLPMPVKIAEPPKGAIVARWNGASMRNIVRSMLRYSTNLTAEITGLTTTIHRGVEAKTLAESAISMTEWLRLAYNVEQAKFIDHSGLGSGSHIPAREMAEILQRAGWNGPLRPVLRQIALKAETGSQPVKNVDIRAKTGTLNFVSALSGYVACPNGRKLVFAIFSADMAKRQAVTRSDREMPEGASAWNKRAKKLQHVLLRRWVQLFDSIE